MNIQQNSWGLSLGLVPVHKSLYIERSEEESRVKVNRKRNVNANEISALCFKLRQDIKEKLLGDNLYKLSWDLYFEMKQDGLLTDLNNQEISYHRFDNQLYRVRKELGVDVRKNIGKTNRNGGTQKPKIIAMHKEGLSITEISERIGARTTYIRECLVKERLVPLKRRGRAKK